MAPRSQEGSLTPRCRSVRPLASRLVKARFPLLQRPSSGCTASSSRARAGLVSGEAWDKLWGCSQAEVGALPVLPPSLRPAAVRAPRAGQGRALPYGIFLRNPTAPWASLAGGTAGRGARALILPIKPCLEGIAS